MLVAAVAFGAGFALRGRPDSTPTTTSRATSSAAQLAAVETGCDDWASSSSAAPAGRPDAWCAGMVDWMTGQTGSMMGSGMWAGPDQLRESCRQWADDNPDQSGDSAASTCRDMATWMNGNSTGGWGMWMMHDR